MELKNAVTNFCKGKKFGPYLVRYNVNFLNDLSSLEKQNLKEIVKKLQNENEQDGPLIKMLDRYFDPQFIKLKLLQGPVTLRKFTSSTLPHIIYIFGDSHLVNSSCPNEYPVNKLIVDLTNKLPFFLDIFVEGSYVYKSGITRDTLGTSILKNSYLERVLSEFSKDCFTHLKKNCNFSTSRIHYTDMRFFFNSKVEENLFTLLLRLISHNLIGKIKGDTSVEFKNNIKKIKYFFERDKDMLKKYLFDKKELLNLITLGIRHKRTIKQIKNIPSSDIADILEKYMEEGIAKFVFNIAININENKRQGEISYEQSSVNLFRIMEKIIEFYTIYMDVYLVARIFRTFRQIPNKYSEPAYNSIVYVGNNHAKNYEELLKRIGFNMVYFQENNLETIKDIMERSQNQQFQCLDLKDLPMPLF